MGSKIEARRNNADQWVMLGPELRPGMRGGSISDNSNPEGRQLYQISCSDDDQYTYVERSAIGAADRRLPGSMREIATQGFERVATLKRDSDPYEMTVYPDNFPFPIQVRISHV